LALRADGSRQRYDADGVIETLDARTSVLEDLMLALRLKEGIAPDLLRRARLWVPEIDNTLTVLKNDGLLKAEADHIRLDSKSWLLGNQVFGRIWDLASTSR
jgi:oxygen-independent coproporphyrinogen-3 oxidase